MCVLYHVIYVSDNTIRYTIFNHVICACYIVLYLFLTQHHFVSAPANQFIHILMCFHWHTARHQLCIIIIIIIICVCVISCYICFWQHHPVHHIQSCYMCVLYRVIYVSDNTIWYIIFNHVICSWYIVLYMFLTTPFGTSYSIMLYVRVISCYICFWQHHSVHHIQSFYMFVLYCVICFWQHHSVHHIQSCHMRVLYRVIYVSDNTVRYTIFNHVICACLFRVIYVSDNTIHHTIQSH